MEGQEKTIKIDIVKESLNGKNISVVTLKGYIDSYNSQYFQNTVITLIDEGSKYIIIDAALLSYISSAGIGAFMAITRKLDDESGDLIVCSLNAKVLEVFNLLGFTTFFKITENRDKAMAQMKAGISGGSAAAIEMPAENMIKEIIFPLIFSCPACSKKLKAPKPGRYRCLQCQSIISIDQSGNASKV